MSRDKDFKRLVQRRMLKTGEFLHRARGRHCHPGHVDLLLAATQGCT